MNAKVNPMSRRVDETPREYLQRLMAAMDFEMNCYLDCLPSVEALIEYFELWGVYGTEFYDGIQEAIHDGADSAPFYAFVQKHKLNWEIIDHPPLQKNLFDLNPEAAVFVD